jgi:hypothetical protein
MFSGLHLLLRQSQAKVSSYQCHPIGSHRMVLVGVHMVNGIGLLLGLVSTTVLIRTGMLLGKGTILDIGLEILAITSRMILGSSVTIVFGARIIAEPAMAKTTLCQLVLFVRTFVRS